MGAQKFRQGRSVNLGLVKNVDHSTAVPYSHHSGVDEETKMGWLMAAFHVITKPFTKVIQNYRRKV